MLSVLSSHIEQMYLSLNSEIGIKYYRADQFLIAGRELIPPITAFLEEDLKLVHTGGNLTPGDGVGSRRSFRTPTQKLTVVKPPCYLPTRVT